MNSDEPVCEEPTDRPCGCPYGDPHMGDCRGYREATKEDYAYYYERDPDELY